MKKLKQCCRCKEVKKLTDFYKRSIYKDGHNYMCKMCAHEDGIKYYKRKMEENPNHQRDVTRRYREMYPDRLRDQAYRRSYNLTLEEYNQMFEIQCGCCAICCKHQNELKRPLGVDHDHITGKVRGLLCNHCNSGIGFFNDDFNLFNKAKTYLENAIL